MPRAPILTQIQGVLGPIEPSDLGVTFPHEHLLLDMARVTNNLDAVLADMELALIEIRRLKDAGASTVVDATSVGLGREPEKIRSLAMDSGLNVVMGCGYYRESFYPPEIDRRMTNDIADEIIRDITEGVPGSGIRAGIIGEIGADLDFISGVEERVLRAAARAHLHTGVTITTHAIRCPLGLAQLDVVSDEGVEPHRVIIGHCDLYPDPDYHLALAERGAWVEFDRVAGKFTYEVARRIRWIKNLIDHGHIDRILLSSDICLKSDLRTYGGTGYDYILTGFVPELRKAGLSDAQVDQILVQNPRVALTGLLD